MSVLPAIDIVCNLNTIEVERHRPQWINTFHNRKFGRPEAELKRETLDDLLERRAMSVDGVIELAVPRDELVRRMLARGREDDDPEIFAKRISSFEVQTAPLLDYYGRQG